MIRRRFVDDSFDSFWESYEDFDDDFHPHHEADKRQYADYGHLRFGKRSESPDYGHLRFGRNVKPNDEDERIIEEESFGDEVNETGKTKDYQQKNDGKPGIYAEEMM